MTKRLLKGMPIDLGVTGDGCTAFITRNEEGEANNIAKGYSSRRAALRGIDFREEYL